MLFELSEDGNIMSSEYKFVKIFLLLLVCASSLYAGTTGKLKGDVTDKQTGEIILGANIIIEGTYFGAASDLDGYY